MAGPQYQNVEVPSLAAGKRSNVWQPPLAIRLRHSSLQTTTAELGFGHSFVIHHSDLVIINYIIILYRGKMYE